MEVVEVGDPQYQELLNNLDLIHSLMVRLAGRPDLEEAFDYDWMAEKLIHIWVGVSYLKALVEVGFDEDEKMDLETYVSVNRVFTYVMDMTLKLLSEIVSSRPDLGERLRALTRRYVDELMKLFYDGVE